MAWVVAYFENGGSPATGLTPLLKIRAIDSGSLVVEDIPMAEVSNGFYRFDFTTYDITKDYVMLADGVILSNSDRYLEGATGEYGNISNNIYLMSDNVDYRVLLMKKLAENKLELLNNTQDNWVLYDNDGTTPLLVFDVSDVNGEAIMQATSMASKRSKAEEG